MTELGLLDLKNLFIAENLAGAAVYAYDEQFASVLRGGGEPDFVTHNYRRGPCPAVNRRLPLHIFRFAPGQRQIPGVGAAIPVRPAELRPVLTRPRRESQHS